MCAESSGAATSSSPGFEPWALDGEPMILSPYIRGCRVIGDVRVPMARRAALKFGIVDNPDGGSSTSESRFHIWVDWRFTSRFS